MRFLLGNLISCSNLGGKLTSLKFQVQLPIYNVHAIMHGRHDLTGNEDKSLKVACVAGAKRGGGRGQGEREKGRERLLYEPMFLHNAYQFSNNPITLTVNQLSLH